MSELLALGPSHKTAPVALRERTALTETGAGASWASSSPSGDHRGRRPLDLQPHRALSRDSDPVEPRAPCSAISRALRRRPTELAEGIYSLRNCDAARHLYRVASGLESMVVGEPEVQGQVKRAYEAALGPRRPGRSPTSSSARPSRPASACARTPRSPPAGRRSPPSRSTPRATRSATSARATSCHRRGRDGRGHRAGAPRRRASRRCSSRTGGASGRSPWRSASAAHGRVRRAARGARAGRHRARLDLLAAPDPRGGGARARPAGARRAAAAAGRPRGAARHRPGLRGAPGRDALRHRRPPAPGRPPPLVRRPRRARPRASSRRRSRRSRAGSARSR